ncbi:branched-chain amino acid aminotransferase [Ohtaekwangia koreensis]|uniref:branched-chain-amino-acid transaminase n=1 Tax=Ohtaekwangia koreensis TaxID=688867 RepID=A0A1T5LRE8_9BACT|nr:branched-chain amino acid aminotransferase [Ohtaekwangia koreensis]SKC78098.1 branched-chain amino acid aminotransferase [Ohtaekwangia koreensis]
MTTLTTSIPVQRIAKSRIKEVDFNNLEFGKYIADHMVVADFKDGKWHEPAIFPYGDMLMSPAMLSLHYGQAVFEGMKAFFMNDGNINIFRPQKHHARFNRSLDRMCMPQISEEAFIQSLRALIELDKDWIPTSEGSSFYIRPFMFAYEARLGVKVADHFKFIIINSPVAAYQAKPYRLKVEDTYVRTAEGGTGFAKCAGNYGGAFYPTQIAREEGFDQILWTDHKEHKYIDEVGMMNVMFVINGKLVTPKLTTAILDGITRDTILTLAKDMGVTVEERKVSIDEIEAGLKDGSVTEAFGTGTAAVVAPIAVIKIKGNDLIIPEAGPDSFQLRVKKKLNDIRMGVEPDKHGWNYIIHV